MIVSCFSTGNIGSILQGDFFPFCSANWADLVSMFNIGGNAVKME